jgi:predicted ATP-grasp superfamily ATP-dependent carboligase
MTGVRILVTDGDERAALAVTRSLGKAGHQVHVLSSSGRSLAGASRHAASEHTVPDPLRDPLGCVDAVAAQARQLSAEILIPVTEASLLAILPGRAASPSLIPFPEIDTFRRASDKAEVARAAGGVGIRVPNQVVVPEPGWSGGLPEDPDRSFVLKPSRSVEGGRKLGVTYSRGGGALAEAIGRLPAQAFPLLVQERILGHGAGIFLLTWEGRVHAVFGHRRIREKPPSGGVSVVRESARVEPALTAAATDLLRSLSWNGVAMVEFKVEDGTGTPFLMEINGRFWGSLQLAVDAGVDFPRILVDAARGVDPGPPAEYPEGVRCRWLLGDFDQLLARLRRSPARLNLPPGAPGRATALKEFLVDFLPPTRLEVLRMDDPRPFARELRAWMRDAWR